MRRVKHARRAVGIGVVLACVFGTMALGTALKNPCAGGDFSNGRQYRLLCYTDIVPLLATEQLAEGRLPFLDRCQESDNNCDEYPVLTMYLMRVAAWFSGQRLRVVLLRERGAPARRSPPSTALCLWLLAGLARPLVRARPDAARVRHDQLGSRGGRVRDGRARRVREATRRMGRRVDRARRRHEVLPGAGAGPAVPAGACRTASRIGPSASCGGRRERGVAINLPFAIAAPGTRGGSSSGSTRARTPDFDSFWYLACRHVDAMCISIDNVNLAALTGVPGVGVHRDLPEGRGAIPRSRGGRAACRC